MFEFKSLSLIPGYEDYVNHEMNINGVLRNNKTGLLRKWCSDTKGYLQCYVHMNSKRKLVQQHRAIALLFISNPLNKPLVDHINGVVNDNRVDNLRWCTRSENGCNSKTPCTNHVGYKNIRKECKRGKRWYWRITVNINGKLTEKYFRCDEDDTEPPAEVIAVRDQMLVDLHGDFARVL